MISLTTTRPLIVDEDGVRAALHSRLRASD